MTLGVVTLREEEKLHHSGNFLEYLVFSNLLQYCLFQTI